MKNMIAILLIGLLAVSPALAVEYDGGDLVVEHTFSANQVKQLRSFTTAGTAVDYSNVTTFLGSTALNGGAANQAGNTITRLTADDITPTGTNAGLDVLEFRFSVVNLNTVPITYRPRVRFWFANGAGGAPGTYYNVPVSVGFTFNPLTLAAGSASVYFTTLAPGQFTMPGTTFWAGVTFDNNTGATGATAAMLNNLGQGLFNPPTVGSSADQYFHTTAAGSFFTTANPVGALANFSGNPVANFGWEFTTDVTVGVEKDSWTGIKSLYR